MDGSGGKTDSTRPGKSLGLEVHPTVFLGTAAVMLSAETAVGKYPGESVRVMDRIIRAAEEDTEPGVLRPAKPRRSILHLRLNLPPPEKPRPGKQG